MNINISKETCHTLGRASVVAPLGKDETLKFLHDSKTVTSLHDSGYIDANRDGSPFASIQALMCESPVLPSACLLAPFSHPNPNRPTNALRTVRTLSPARVGGMSDVTHLFRSSEITRRVHKDLHIECMAPVISSHHRVPAGLRRASCNQCDYQRQTSTAPVRRTTSGSGCIP